MSPRPFFFFFLLILLLAPCAHGAAPVLEQISRENYLTSTRLTLKLSGPVNYRVQRQGQRVDVLLDGADAAASLRFPPTDDKIVKVLLARSKKELMVSLLLRKAPTRVNATANRGAGGVHLELYWDENEGRPPIAFRISGLPARQGGKGAATPRLYSPYGGRWEAFFQEYRLPLRLEIPLFYTVPDRPEGVAGLEGSSGKLFAAGRWSDFLLALQSEPLPASREGRERRSLARGEALLRLGKAEALRVLAPLARPETPPLPSEQAIYFYALAAATSGDPYLARYQLSRVESPTAVWSPLLQLLRAEVALTIGKPSEALAALEREGVVWPPSLHPVRELRIADALAASGRLGAAREIYQRLLLRPEMLMAHPFSLRYCAETFAAAGEFEQAAFLYGELARKIPMGPDQGMALVAAARAFESAGAPGRGIALLSEAWKDFPRTDAGHRARLRLLDHDVLSGDEMRRRTAEVGYIEVATRAPRREVREEAAFKRALLLYLNGEKEKSARLLLGFGRDFAAGSLRPEAGILLREIVPSVVTDMIARGEDLQALVLVERAREDLLAGGMNLTFLLDVAHASARLGLLERASRVYRYVLDAPGDAAEKEPIYRPFIELALLQGERAAAEEFGRRYLDRYPKGRDRAEVYLLYARALEEGEEGLEKVVQFLRKPGRPRTVEVELLAADAFWRAGDYRGVADCFPNLQDAPPRGVLLKAEALFRVGRPEGALPLFRRLLQDESVGDQAAFRAAEIEIAAGRRGAGVNLLKSLAEKGKDPRWRHLAGETLAVENL